MDHDIDKIEFYIVKSLIESQTFCQKFNSKIRSDLFSSKAQDIIKGVLGFFNKYGKPPTYSILKDKVLPQVCKKTQNDISDSIGYLKSVKTLEFNYGEQSEWLGEETKKFIKTRRIMNAIVSCVDLIEKHKHDEVVSVMEDAFQVNFDESLGCEYFEGLEDRLERSSIQEEVITTGLRELDNRIGGGYRRKSMFVFAGPSNVGKTLVLNDAASTLCMQGYNVLYLSMELSEDYIQKRTDAKFANVPINEINVNPQFAIKKAIAKRNELKKKNVKLGKLFYKEYAPNSICSNDIKALLKNLEVKDGFYPDFIVVDYLGLVRPNGKVFSDNTYGKIKTVCEELRALAVVYNACVMSAVQTNRNSYGQSSIGMQDVSDSIGIAQTADVLVTMARPADLDEENSMLINISKSRFSRNGGTFMVGVCYEYMKLVDIDGEDKDNIYSQTPTNVIRQLDDDDDDPKQKKTVLF